MPHDWTMIIERNHAVLLWFVAMLAAMVGVEMSREAYRAALSKLRQLESAVRRLIVIVSRDVVAKLDGRPMPAGWTAGKVNARRHSSFPLFDPRRQIGPHRSRGAPMIRFLDEPAAAPAKPDIVETSALLRRVARMQRALGRLEFEAMRLARWRLRRPYAVRRPMRPGRPPGHFARHRGDPLQELLADLQVLALYALEPGRA